MSVRRTIFERYGGFASVSKVVLDFYDKILDSPVTSPFFANTDMKRLIDHQTKFISTIMGGPASYSNEHVEKVHKRLGITEVAFLEAIELLRETLEDHSFQEDDIETVEDEMMSYKNFVVARR